MKIITGICLTIISLSSALSQTIEVHAVKDSSSVTYKLVHPLHEIEATSNDVVFDAIIDSTRREFKAITANVDVTTFDSGNSNRDSHAMEVIEAIDFPGVTFASNSVSQRDDTLSVSGKLTFHGITREIKMTSISSWSEERVRVLGQFALSLTEFKVERPSLLMIPVNDTLRFSVEALFKW